MTSPKVPHPTAVRYAWSNNPEKANLFNKAGLPAPPFRTRRAEVISSSLSLYSGERVGVRGVEANAE